MAGNAMNTTAATPSSESRQLRFMVLDLFVLIAVTTVFVLCASQIGLRNSQFWLSVAVSLAIVCIFVGVFRGHRRSWMAALAVMPLFTCVNLPGVSSLAAFVTSVGLLIFSVSFLGKQISLLRLILVGLSTAAVACAFGVAVGYFRTQDIYTMRDEFPIESLGPRLAYEQSTSGGVTSNSGAATALTTNVKIGLRRFETDLTSESYGSRADDLRYLHSARVDEFFRTAGFGVGRMRYPRRMYLGTPALLEIPFAATEELWEHNLGFSAAWRYSGPTRVDGPLDELHQFSRMDFLHPDGFGGTVVAKEEDEDGPHVAGFVEHAFHWSPLVQLDLAERWELKRLELVSLLKFDQPRVYVLDHLPRMDQLSSTNAPTRALSEFEATALEQLWTREDLVIGEPNGDERAKTVLMLGSLRAAKQCLDCHNVNRGDLLGAFSYELQELNR